MNINKDLLKNQYLEFFINEHRYVTERLLKFVNNRTIHNTNKLKHLQDRLVAANNVISGNFELVDLVTQELYAAIWGAPDQGDKFSQLRLDAESELYKISEQISTKELKHLAEYGKNELKYIVDIIVSTDPAFYLLLNNIEIGKA